MTQISIEQSNVARLLLSEYRNQATLLECIVIYDILEKLNRSKVFNYEYSLFDEKEIVVIMRACMMIDVPAEIRPMVYLLIEQIRDIYEHIERAFSL